MLMHAHRFENVEKRNNLYREQVDAEWKHEHEICMLCFDVRDLLDQGFELYQSISSLDNDWRMLVLRSEIAYSEEFDGRIDMLYRQWLETSHRILNLYEGIDAEYVARGFDTAFAEKLRTAVKEVEGSLIPDAEFFGNGLAKLRDAAIEEFRAGKCEEFCHSPGE